MRLAHHGDVHMHCQKAKLGKDGNAEQGTQLGSQKTAMKATFS